MLKMKLSHISKLLLAIAIVVLLSDALAISRDYQDGWILEGLEIPFALFVITYALAFFSERRTSWIVTLAIIGRTVFLLIPNLKYVWFQGVFIDQHLQYALANHVCNEGHILTQQTVGPLYSTTPLMHLSFSIFSLILNVPVVDSMKYLPVLWSPIYPLLTYVIVKKMEFSQGNTILKYALFISSIPFTGLTVAGSLFGTLLAFLILSTLVLILRACARKILQENDRGYWVICPIFVFALAAAHSVTSVILTASLLAITILQRILRFPPRSYLRVSTVSAVASISGAWLMFRASTMLREVIRQIFIHVPSGTTPTSEYIQPAFYEHARANILSAVRSFSVYYGVDALFLLLTFVGLIILLRMRKQLNSATNFLFLFGWLVLLLVIIGYSMKLGATRSLHLLGLLYPVFSSILVLHIYKNSRARTLMRLVVLLSIIVLATIKFYRCQPLIPSANVLYKELPPEVPVGYVNVVNSIYQRQMINFAENHVDGRIAAVPPTTNQIVGLTEMNFSATNLVRYNPLDKSQPKQEYDYFLIHRPGKSGYPSMEARLRTPSLIPEVIYNSSIIYTNGESYILANNPSKP